MHHLFQNSARNYVAGLTIFVAFHALGVTNIQAQIVALDDDAGTGLAFDVYMTGDIIKEIRESFDDLELGDEDQERLAEFRKHAERFSTHELQGAAQKAFLTRRNDTDEDADLQRTVFDYVGEWLDDDGRLVGMPVAFAGTLDKRQFRVVEVGDEDDKTNRLMGPVKLTAGGSITVIVDAPSDSLDAFEEDISSVISGGMYFKRISTDVATKLGAVELGEQEVVPYIVLSELKPIGMDVDPELLVPIQHRSRVGYDKDGEENPAESRSYYRLLRQTKMLSNSALKKGARETAKYRLKHHAELTKKHYEELIAKADLLEEEDPPRTTEASKIRTHAENYRRQQAKLNRAWTARPEKYSAFLDSIVDPNYFAGRPISVSGRVRKVQKYPIASDIFGIGSVYELWLFPEDGQSNPTVVQCTDMPEGFPIEDNVVENVVVSGYFFKLHAYQAGDSKRVTPMILAKTVEWKPYKQTAWPAWVKPAIIGVIVMIMFGIVSAVRRASQADRKFRAKVNETIDNESEPNFSDLANVAPPTIGPPPEQDVEEATPSTE